MSKLMLITPRMAEPPSGGRALLSQLHFKCLRSILGDRLIVHELDRDARSGARHAIDALRGYIDGISRDGERAIVAQIREQQVHRVYLNGSNLGRVARTIKRHLPDVEILVFFHNVEAQFFLGALKRDRSPHALGVLIANHAAERLAVRHSDRLITLSKRDSDGLSRRYGRAATDLLPMAMEDQLATPPDEEGGAARGDYLLFVGGAFYANEAGIRWFVDKVVPGIGMETRVVGHGLDAHRAELEREGKVRVIGSVDRLDDCYAGAKAVVAPIFDGSGMKTKVAEALMFGKRIVATSEAFSGYEEIAHKVGWICDTSEAFISAIREIETLSLPGFDPSLRLLYERHYSYESTLSRLSRILEAPAGPRIEPSAT